MGLCCSGMHRSTVRLDGMTAIITGCNTGIGKYNALDFYKRGCRVIMACRDVRKAEEAAEDIFKDAAACAKPGMLVIKKLDLSSLTSVRNFAQEILKEEDQINLLINNAGIMACPKKITEDGYELQFATNHLGHFLLTLLLLPRVLHSTPARIINLSSIAHTIGNMELDDLQWERTSYSPTAAYGRSKLANILFTKELARRLQGKDVNVYAVHPGVVNTDLSRNLDAVFPGARWLFKTTGKLFMKTSEQGAQTTLHCALDEKAGRETGLYYSDCRVTRTTAAAMDMESAARLWDVSLQMVGLAGYDLLAAEDMDASRVSVRL